MRNRVFSALVAVVVLASVTACKSKTNQSDTAAGAVGTPAPSMGTSPTDSAAASGATMGGMSDSAHRADSLRADSASKATKGMKKSP